MDEMPGADPYGTDFFTEPDGDPDTIANLGPLRPMAGIFEGRSGSDDHPVAEGGENEAYTERYVAQPIDFQTNGPQLFYGLRYHTHINSPTEDGTFHDQVGYWLWEPMAEQIIYTLAIPRGQALLAVGPASPTRASSSSPRRSDRRSMASSQIHFCYGDSGRSAIASPFRSGPTNHGLTSRRVCWRFRASTPRSTT